MKHSARRPSKSLPQEDGAAPLPAGHPCVDTFGADSLRPWLLAAVCAMFVARPLFPSESACPRGDGLPMVMLWIVLAVIWLLGAIGRPQFRLRFGWTDSAVAVLILLHTAAAIWGAVYGSPRPALNMLWEWIGYGLSFLLARQLVVGPRETRAVVAVMVALAVALAGYGLYQYAYEMPATRREYKENPNQMLRRQGMWYEENSPERKLFENRLESREPLATFALTNSLAGYLAPWLIVALGIALGGTARASGNGGTGPGESVGPPDTTQDAPSPSCASPARGVASGIPSRWGLWMARIGFAIGVLAITACLLLTKSRSGYLATILGVVLAAMFCRGKRLRIGWKMPVAAVAIVAVMVAAGVMVRGLDKEVLSEASKSLGYRLQYWHSAMHIIADHPLLGCGPGNFQCSYTLHKLPEASEEVADPHNFLLEVWATAGTFTMLALTAMLASFAWVTIRRDRMPAGDAQPAPASDAVTVHGDCPHSRAQQAKMGLSASGQRLRADRPLFAMMGLPAGFLLAVPVGLMSEAWPGIAMLLVGLPLGLLTLAVLLPWVQRGRLPDLLPTVGVAVLLVNLLAAGGIGFPGVAGTLWLLVALGLNGAECRPPWALPRAASVAGLVLALGLTLACYETAYRPVLESRAALRAVGEVVSDPVQSVALLERAAKADPLGAEPWVHLATVAFGRWQAIPSSETLDRFERCTETSLRLAPDSAVLWLAAGQRYSQVFARTRQKAAAQRAVYYCHRAVELYPNSPIGRASLALAMQDAGDASGYREQAAKAIELDSLTPHLDKKLDIKLRKRLLRTNSGEN